jgi:hypothetical protein
MHPTISKMFQYTLENPCVLCQGPAAVVGSFTPNNPEAFDADPGKHREIFYGLCENCASEPDFDAIEQILEYNFKTEQITHH